ncbi:glutamate 5-kinase [Francisellaceae bacterium]|nr:glutamate 5-kinase [Francisellaceae bacterium]
MSGLFEQKKRVVIKIGSALLVDNNLSLKSDWLKTLVADVVALREKGLEVVIVSSGSIALGRSVLGLKSHKLQLPEKQASAAVGQIKLVEAYQSFFNQYKINTAQVLLGITDSEVRSRYVNARNTLSTLLKLGAVPIINENDTVATSEIRYGDNDRLAARVAQMVEADLLILLSDIDGLYTANPNFDKTAKHIPIVDEVTKEIESLAGESHTKVSSGGMVTKIAAAKITNNSGCDMVICSGKTLHPIKKIYLGGLHTLFRSNVELMSAKKKWLVNHLHRKGKLVIDEGAVSAIKNGKSLLPVGIIQVEGEFHKGDAVSIVTATDQIFAVGLVGYGRAELDTWSLEFRKKALAKLRINDVTQPIVHRDNMVVTNEYRKK